MIILLEGKAHMEGKASRKTGRPYNMHVVHYLAPAMGVEGRAAQTDMLDGTTYSYADLVVGAKYNVEHDRNGKLLTFARVMDNPSKTGGNSTP